MNKIIATLLTTLSMTGILYAQQKDRNPEDKLFNLPHYSIKEDWRILLGKNNYLELEIPDLSQLPRFQNLDSLLLVFLDDMKVFKDSLADPIPTKCIDYLVDTAGRKMVRIRTSRPAGTSWLLGDQEPSALRLRQDTIHILLLAPPTAKAKGILHSRLTIVINRYDDLQNLVTTGLNAKMQKLEPDGNRRWEDKDGETHLVSDPTIISGISVYSANHEHDYLSLDATFAVQNYKNYFVPSVGLGATIGLQKGEYWHRLGVHWEPLFFFATNNQGQLQTFRNDLLVFNFDYSPANGAHDKENNFGLRTNFSFGTFVHREGNYFPAHSFRLTLGEVNLMRGRFSIDPCLYFNDFFRNVTPGLRFCFKVM